MAKKGVKFLEIPPTFTAGAESLVHSIPLEEFHAYLDWTGQLSRDFDLLPVLYRCGNETLPDVYGYAWTLYISGITLRKIMAQVKEST